MHHLALDFAHHMHLTRFAVKAQGELFLAVDEHQGLGLDGALHSGDTLGLLGAQAHREAYTVLGDHEADLAFFLMRFVGCVNHFDAMAHIKVMRLVVEHVAQKAERIVWVGRGRVHRRRACQALEVLGAVCFQVGQRVAAQRVEHRGRHKPGLRQLQPDVVHCEDTRAKAPQMLAQISLCLGGVGRALMGMLHLCAADVSVFIGQHQAETTRRFAQLCPQADTAVTGFFVQRAYPVHIAVAVDHRALAQVLEAFHRVIGVHAPLRQAAGRHWLGHVNGQAYQFLVQVVVAQAVAVVQHRGRVADFQLDKIRPHLGDPANRLARVLGRVERANVFLAAGHEIVGELPVEVLQRVGREAEGGASTG